MALWLIYRPYSDNVCRNSNGVSGVLVVADDEPSARAKAQDEATSGETKVHADWQAAQLAASASLPGEREVLFLGEVFDDRRRPV